jgi:DNA-binding MarR family transcriptional regulator
MKRRRPKLYVVGQDPGDVFNDLGKLRTDLAAPLRRQRTNETFARIPHDRGLELYRHRLSGTAWAVLIELDRLILKASGRNPVRFWSPRLREIGITQHTRTRALRQLEAAGVIKVEQRGKGLSPWVLHLWYPYPG